jgi:hypothetical protein
MTPIIFAYANLRTGDVQGAELPIRRLITPHEYPADAIALRPRRPRNRDPAASPEPFDQVRGLFT